jgi:hypothetical protein
MASPTRRLASPTRRLASILLVLGLALLLLAFPAGAAANSNNPITQTGGMSATLPLLGTSLTVDVTLDGVGNISGVALNPTGVVSQTSADKSVVKFSNSGGTVKVTVRASGDHMAIKAKAKLGDLLGAGSWSANVFGTGSATVKYTVGKDGSGDPTVSIGTITTPGGVTATKVGPKSGADAKRAWAFAGVTFSSNGFTKRLTISVSEKKSDGSARLAIVLSGRDKQKLSGTLAQLAGDRTWNAKLCDGTAVSVAYHVGSDGKVVFDKATGAPYKEQDLKAGGEGKDPDKSSKTHALVSGIAVHFTKTNVGLVVWLQSNGDGTYTLKVLGRSGHCGGDGKGKGHRHHVHHGWSWAAWHRLHGDRKPQPKP